MVTDEERHQMGYASANAHLKQGGKISTVSFKDEGSQGRSRIGPVYAFAEGVDPHGWARPFDGPDPEGVFYLGWQTHKAASTLAKSLNAVFESW